MSQNCKFALELAAVSRVVSRHVSPYFSERDDLYEQSAWRARLGSNQQPLPSEGSTLSIELRAQRGGLSHRPCGAPARPGVTPGAGPIIRRFAPGQPPHGGPHEVAPAPSPRIS
jgi:hypothetical protein